MKKRTMGVLTLLIILVGSCATLAVASPITNLGDVDYHNTQNNFLVNDTILGNVNLTFVYSEMNESSLIPEKIWYNNNVTTYRFTTDKTYVEWWFTPGIKYFVYQDMATNKLYSVGVNYTGIYIPENPYEERHRQLVENYTLILSNYNLTNSTLANITLQFNELDELYNQTMQQFNMTSMEKQNLSEKLTNLTKAFIELDERYNKTDALWDSAVGNVTTLQTKYDGKVTDYNDLEKDHNDLSGALPWYIIITIIGTFLFTYIYVGRKTIFGPQPEATDEITTGYGKVHSAIDKHILSRFRGGQKTGNEGEIEEITEWKEVPPEETSISKEIKDEPIKQIPQDDILTMVHEKIDKNTRMMTEKFTGMFKDLDKKIDKVISERA